jgi:hypothetical protein
LSHCACPSFLFLSCFVIVLENFTQRPLLNLNCGYLF